MIKEEVSPAHVVFLQQIKGQTSMRATKNQVVNAPHGHSQLQRSQLSVAGVLSRNRTADGRGNGLIERGGKEWIRTWDDGGRSASMSATRNVWVESRLLAKCWQAFDSSVGRAVDCSWQSTDIHRSLVQIRLEGDFFYETGLK
ncbi:hypothetical protein EVAR_32017_1 [Eumeta japonica]|uniref:Uncharacterized protein n=1 Tax=Eumeta variegata TaxID=151549 RepID=A0A4C1YLB5_EUMVA|nr:hypothetical protein EVAR_32017_1 [Eumeta japonica]